MKTFMTLLLLGLLCSFTITYSDNPDRYEIDVTCDAMMEWIKWDVKNGDLDSLKAESYKYNILKIQESNAHLVKRVFVVDMINITDVDREFIKANKDGQAILVIATEQGTVYSLKEFAHKYNDGFDYDINPTTTIIQFH